MFSNVVILTNQLVALKWYYLVYTIGIVVHLEIVYLDIGQNEQNVKYSVDQDRKWIQRDVQLYANQIKRMEKSYNGK